MLFLLTCVCVIEGFYLPASLASLHPHPPPSVSSSSTPPQRTSRDSRDKPYRGDRERDRERSREELRPHSVVDRSNTGRPRRGGAQGEKQRQGAGHGERRLVGPLSPKPTQVTGVHSGEPVQAVPSTALCSFRQTART